MSRERRHSRSKDKPTGIPEPNKKKKEPAATKHKKAHGEKAKSDSEPKKSKTKSDSESKKLKGTKLPLKEKQSKRKEEQERIPTPEPVVQIAETYEDDFEDYTDDFESDDEDENVIREPNVVDQRPVTAVSSTSNSSGKSNDLMPQSPPKSSTPPKEENENDEIPIPPPVMEETPLLRRLATRQGGRAPDPATPPAMPRLASADRRIDFSSASTIDPNAFTEMNERYRKLRELIGQCFAILKLKHQNGEKTTVMSVLEPTFYTIVDIPPIKDYDFYMELFGQSGKSQDDYGWGLESTAHEDPDMKENEEMAMFRENHLQNPRLKQFLEAAGQVDGSVEAFDLLEPSSSFSSSMPWIGTDAGFLCSLSKAKTASARGPRLIESKMSKIFVICFWVPFEEY
ncbi:hypothetical protein TELCIR_06977 [Teladorsagia circumcincta]|uniref:Uncharacterized protein n=1 Tax=Teladorsagia circumcincta TaxID=45464 RepID=A0A2G9ULI9_TELCI|nr:hypothetical protein TELCIR_06977 [Teladorsagia circumcincta]